MKNQFTTKIECYNNGVLIRTITVVGDDLSPSWHSEFIENGKRRHKFFMTQEFEWPAIHSVLHEENTDLLQRIYDTI